MPSLELKDLQNIKTNDIFKNFPTFIETGTYFGDTILAMELYFKNLHTIEIKKEFYLNIVEKYKGAKIKFHLGDSSEKLKEVVKQIKTPGVFFLDGHWSACGTGRGKKDCPLYEELEIIMKDFEYNNIIIIDDVRLFGKGPKKGNEICNWENINNKKILEIVSNRLEKNYFIDSEHVKNDRLVLHLNKII
jgi:hypothetical protein